jgi:hypothetical protein
MINKHFKVFKIESAEIFSAGKCNLSCRYCYIPKADFLTEIHKKVLDKVRSGKLLEELKELFDKDLTSLSHWGTEPTLTLDEFKDFYNQAIVEFPNLKNISISSNYMTNPDKMIKFILNLPKTRQLEIKLQVSLDGPPSITDKNRIGGAAEKITKNCIEVTRGISRHNSIHNVSMHLKPTMGSEEFRWMTILDNVKTYYDFFDNFITKWLESNFENRIKISRFCSPTIVVPGDYTTEDGINFYQMLLNQISLQNIKYKSIEKPESDYYYRWVDKIPFFNEFYFKPFQYICSAGNMMFGIGESDNELHNCHRTYFIQHPEYVDSMKKYSEDKITISSIESGRNDLLLSSIANTSDEASLIKFLYRNRAYRDFHKQRSAIGTALAMELADCKQISKCYKLPEMAFLLNVMSQLTDCQMDHVIINGSASIPTLGILRLYGNGFCENILSRSRR